MLWLSAKTHVQVADAVLHEVSAHLWATHIVMEAAASFADAPTGLFRVLTAPRATLPKLVRALPAGAPRNVRIGFVQGYPLTSLAVPVLLLPGTVAQEKMVLVSRDPRLNPTAVLEVTAIRGRIAVARIVRGQPQPRDEVVLPSTDLSERSQELPP